VASGLIGIEQARAIVLGAVRPLGQETVAVQDALGRVLAEDVVAAGDVPGFACSAMDGYAVRSGPAERDLAVVGESRAGAPTDRAVQDGEAIRISTGAAVPPGADAVIRQEDVDERDAAVHTLGAVAPDANIRHAGEDLRAGTKVLSAGTVLGPAELGAAVGAGAGELTVARQPLVAILCTGDELRAPGEPLGPGEIHNSNMPMLQALAVRSGALAPDPGRLPDSPAETEAGLASALARADVVVVSGGVSVGPHDHVKPALAALGVRELFWGIALQPGKPTWFGERGGKLVFGLPGNPVSSVVTFILFVRPALAALQEMAQSRRPLEAQLGAPVQRNPAREQALRVRLERQDGNLFAIPNGPQGSHLVSSLVGADALAFIPAGEGELPAGASVALEHLPR
jgi:molybdopterin molybdotransferase